MKIVRCGVALLSLVVFGSIFVTSIFVSLPSNVLVDRGGSGIKHMKLLEYWPQGWSFFTRPPTESTLVAYSTNSSPENLMQTPQGKGENIYGLTRSQRAQGPELAILANSVISDEWYTCPPGSSVNECLESYREESNKSVEFKNDYPNPSICGDALIAEAAVVDWSYRELYQESVLPSQILVGYVECER
ncbi:SdpA family antimicrobial peptide system protein [Kocuria sp.]|uniref:SdpA family antimicrobial peptide system protein n=1 Tax=Kocuria sp. TaxID=1871328 RepID=UPI0026E07812|nr:SdpA family antimicrobial peptide system protein [Kocuria sp.]MDO5617837.1 SdpA family antimicrobial peptide system protein [Kocuria sp.]